MSVRVALWVGFGLCVLFVLGLDLGVARGRTGPVTTRSAVRWTVLWVALSILMGVVLYFRFGATKGLQFFTGYLIEYALSVDNLFVFLLVFRYFKVESQTQHKLLFWGVLGAFAMRAGLIVPGSALVNRFEWLLLLFGAFLVFTAMKMLFGKDGEDEVAPESNKVARISAKLLPIARGGAEGRFFTREDGRLKLTKLFLVLVVVETTDLLFALDSIPAVLGISKDPFILYSSNVCAVLGLRSLYFLIASLMERLRFLKPALSAVLAFVGLKMLLDPWFHLSIGVSLAVVGGMLLTAVLASNLIPARGK